MPGAGFIKLQLAFFPKGKYAVINDKFNNETVLYISVEDLIPWRKYKIHKQTIE